MGLIYVACSVIIGISVLMNLIIKRPDEKKAFGSSTLVWSMLGIPFVLVFIYLAITEKTHSIPMYIFHVLSTCIYMWLFRVLEYKRKYAPAQVTLGIMLFVVAWTFVGVFTNMSPFPILLPSVMALAGTNILLATYFFVRSDEEIQLRTVLGVLFSIMTVLKIMYLIDPGADDPIFVIGLFFLDYMIYIVTSLLLFFNNYYRSLMRFTLEGMLLSDAVNSADYAMAIVDVNGNVVFKNKFIEKDIEGSSSPMINVSDLMDYYGLRDNIEVRESALNAIKQKDIYAVTYDYEGSLEGFKKAISIESFTNQSNNEPYAFFAIKDYKVEEEVVEKQEVYNDDITLLPNIVEMTKAFEKYQLTETTARICLAIIQVENYDLLTDKLGEIMSREYLNIITGFIKSFDCVEMVGKHSVDQFEVIIRASNDLKFDSQLKQIVQKIVMPYRFSNYEVVTDIQVGIAVYPEDGITHGALVKNARIALAKAGPTEQERIQFYSHNYMSAMDDRQRLELRLHKAVEKDEFHIVYQPQVDANNENFRGFEALLRWGKDGEDVISPNLFIPIAEEMGIIEEIGGWVLEEAIKAATSWRMDFDRDFIMSVNISSMQLEQKDFCDNIRHLLKKYDYKPEFLELEVTETRLIKTTREVYRTLKEIKDMGVKIALDDFGTGYSSLDYLRWLPFDVLKIDKSFIDNLNHDSVERAIVHSVIGLVNKMNLETIAEGVENDEQLKSLQESSCTYIQGYLYSKPLNDAEVREILLNME